MVAIREAAAALDFGQLSRLVRTHTGFTQQELATITGVSQNFLSQLENGQRRLSDAQKAARFLDGLGAPHGLHSSPPLDDPQTRNQHRDPHETIRRAATESLDFADFITSTNTDDDLLAFLYDTLARIATDYVHKPVLPLLDDIVAIRDRVFALLRGRQKPQHTRDLYFLAGTSCLLLAHASQNLGDSTAALAQIRTANACAHQADHRPLRAWTAGTAALIAEWSPRGERALELIDQAAALAPAGQSRIRIAAIEARTSARNGDKRRATAALLRMQMAQEEVPEADGLAVFGGILTFPQAKQDYYTGATHNLLGSHDEAECYAARAIDQYVHGPSEARSYGDEALATVDVIIARLAQGDIEAALPALRMILSLPVERRIQQLGHSVQKVTELLRTPTLLPKPTTREVLELAHNYQVLGTSALPSER
ncbi:helix-turn-helix transcriptional regulator [Streptomyces sp. NPDC001787]|uniref:helix-turn-helix domain-containing protein n=1 Tax=Streptomyces sp. NPDC001787 TaxID=3154523 RepID=UPI00332C6F34